MEKVLSFLKECGTFYFATVDGDKPKVRPFGFCMEHDGKLYFGMGKQKQSYKQVLANPNVEISATNANRQWIRISGVAVMDDSEETMTKVFEVAPGLKNIYNEKTGFVMGVLYLTNGVAEIMDMKGTFEKISF